MQCLNLNLWVMDAGGLVTGGAPLQHEVLIDGFSAPTNTAAPVFPYHENTSEWDEYGELINPDDYVIREAELMDYTNTQPVFVSKPPLCLKSMARNCVHATFDNVIEYWM